MRIQVINDNKTVFEGDAKQWLTDNQGDEITAEMIAETAEKGWTERNLYHSGKWEVRRIMTKAEAQDFIKDSFTNMLQKILLAEIDYLGDGEFYGWTMDGGKYRLVNQGGSYFIEIVGEV